MKLEHLSLSANEKIGLISNLSTMLSAGIPILETVDSLLEDAKGNQKKILETLREDIMQGKHVYFSFAKFPNVFDSVTTNIIKASEEAGTLDVTLKDLKETIKKEVEFSDKIRSALVYPIVIMIVFMLVLLLILIVVIPKISLVFSRLKVELPLPTKIMIFTSDLLIHNTLIFVGSIAAIVFGIVFLYKSNKRFLLGMLFSLPLVSQLAKEIDLTRFSRSLYLLLTSGIPITTALELTQDVVMKKEISKIITNSRDQILAGKKFSDGLKTKKHIVPGIMIKIIEAGERSGSLDKSMQEISDFLDYQVSKTLKTVTTLMEPIMLVFVGILVGGMMLAIIAPIYGLIGQIGSR